MSGLQIDSLLGLHAVQQWRGAPRRPVSNPGVFLRLPCDGRLSYVRCPRPWTMDPGPVVSRLSAVRLSFPLCGCARVLVRA